MADAAELSRYQTHLKELVAQRTAQLAEATERANSANLAKSAFLANMSHELRTPMNAILGFADLLRSGHTDPDQRDEYLSIISRSGQHLLALINDVLDVSKIESGRIDLSVSAVDVRALAREVVGIMEDRANDRGLSLSLALAGELPRAIRADEVKLRQILLNLLSNAIKCTAEGGVTLGVSLTSDLRTLMEKVGVLTCVAPDGALGVQAFTEFGPDLIWMDRRMPVMDGIEATQRIRAATGGGTS